jgi:glycosyltransferase involved in cell wall biosynthesis
MRFSVLIPTRNRLEYLRYAVETVRRQSYEDWEIVIADNASDEDVAGYVGELADPRVIYTRSDDFIPVTDNWNRALERSTGDYVIMLGDDDGLLQDCFTTLSDLAKQFDEPEAIYLNAYQFAYPGAVAEYPDGYLQPYGYALFLRGATEPFVLAPDVASTLARDVMDFRVRYGFNMQFVATSRRMIETMSARGPFYQSAFPDYFAMNAIFLLAPRIVVCPRPVVVIGISPKSYGHYYQKRQAATGDQFLGSFPADVSPELRSLLLPGNSINNGWLFAADALERAFGSEFGLRLNRRRYREVQMRAMARDAAAGAVDPEQVRDFVSRLTARERFLFAAARFSSRVARMRVLQPAKRAAAKVWHIAGPRFRGGAAQFLPWDPPRVEGRYRSVVDVFEQVRS